MRQRVVLDVARAIAQRVELGKPGHRARRRSTIPVLDAVHRALQLRIGERSLAFSGMPAMSGARCSSFTDPGWSAMPASTSATVAHMDGFSKPLPAAPHVHETPKIARQQRIGAARRNMLGLLGAIVWRCRDIHAERSPKPQQTSARASP